MPFFYFSHLFHQSNQTDKAHALLLRLHWQLQQAYSPLATAITPAFHTVNGKAASMAAAIAPAFHNVKGRATGFATESIAALLTWLSEARARLTEKIVWSVIVHKAQGWLNAVLAAVMALVASVCAVWEERVASRRNKQDQTTTKQEQQQATAAAVGVAAPVSPVPSAASEEGRDVKEQQQPSPASAAASKATVEGGKAAFVGASPIPGAAAATLTGYLAATASSFFFPVPTADAGSSSMPPAATERWVVWWVGERWGD